MYTFETDGLGRVILKITDGSNVTYRLVTTMSNSPAEAAQSQFIGTSSSGFTGVLDAPDSYFDQLGLVPCAYNSSGDCDTSTAQLRRAHSLMNVSDSSDYFNNDLASRKNILLAGPAALHTKQNLKTHRRNMQDAVYSFHEDPRTLGVLDDSAVSGVQSPLICLKAGQGVMWSVSTTAGISHYPQYVPDSLFNTNPSFDYGSFLNLKKDVEAGRPVSSFYQAFSTAGIYVFQDGGDESKQTVVGVVAPLVDCPSAFEKNPIQVLSTDNLQVFPSGNNPAVIAPDYALIVGVGGAMAALLVCSLGCLYLRRMLGWGRRQVQTRSYREKQKKGKEDLHSMALKRQTGRSVQSVSSNKVLDTLDDQAAGYVDLEGFNVQALFDKLQDQTNLVTEQLTKQKDDVKEFYEKVERTLNGKLSDLTNDEVSDLERRAQRRQRRIDDEVLRRKRMGNEVLALASAQKNARNAILYHLLQSGRGLIEFDQKFQRFLSELLRAVRAPENESQILFLKQNEVSLRVELTEIADVLNQAPHITIGSGAELVDHDLVETGIFGDITIPSKSARIRIRDELTKVPPNCFVHPDSRRILPIEGNLWYDVVRNRFCVGSQLTPESVRAGPLPYICNVLGGNGDCYPASSAPFAHLLPSDNWWPLSEDRTILDSFTGLRVPVVGVTWDYRTQKLALVGGTMVDPETRLLKPIRMYDIMEDLKTRNFGIVLGVTIDPKSLKAIPIFGRYVWIDFSFQSIHVCCGCSVVPARLFVF